MSVLALSSDDALVYVGGEFAEVEGETRGGLATLTTSDGSVAPFAPDNEYVFMTMGLAGNDTELYVIYYDLVLDSLRLLVFTSTGGDDDDSGDDDDDDDGDGGGGSSSRRSSGTSSNVRPLIELQLRLIELLQQIIALIISQQRT